MCVTAAWSPMAPRKEGLTPPPTWPRRYHEGHAIPAEATTHGEIKRLMAHPELGEPQWGMGQGKDLSQVCMGSPISLLPAAHEGWEQGLTREP